MVDLKFAFPIIRAVLDIKLIREQPDFVRQRLATRGAGDEQLIHAILHADDMRRGTLKASEALKARRNSISKEIYHANSSMQSINHYVPSMYLIALGFFLLVLQL
jgi:seryl-tRNA synthetase